MTHETIDLDWRMRERRSREGRQDGWQTSGGVVVNVRSGRVLLVKNRRERREGRSGWTWPKGRIDPGEGPVFAAMREIAEEAGVLAEPLARVALIETSKALRHYYLLSMIRDDLPFHGETLEVRWVSPQKAKTLLERKRDRVVLRASQRMLVAVEQGHHGSLLWHAA